MPPRRRLRRLLARAVFFGVAATQHGCCCPDYDNPTVDVDVDRTMPEIAMLIDRCEANPDDCEPLCRAALEIGLGPENAMYVEIADCAPTPIANGSHIHIEYYENVACGRAPSGLRSRSRVCAAVDPVTAWLARAAYLEAASIAAFIHLAADLVRHRAPRALIAAAIVAAHDEVRHATTLRALIGVPVPVPRVMRYRPASLRELALQNATEGCARETIGAAINLWQARCATDPVIRTAFARIAEDEIAHAELAWRVHAWATSQLGAGDVADVAAAHHTALARIADGDALDPAAQTALGLPSRAEQSALVAQIRLEIGTDTTFTTPDSQVP